MELTSGDRAALRRGTDPWAVRGFYGLLREYDDVPEWVVALAAPILAQIREPTDQALGQIARSVLSELRLRRLLDSRDRDDLVNHLTRIVRMSGRGNARNILETIQFWGDNMRRTVARDYFEAAK